MNILFVHSEQDPFSTVKPLETLERVHFGISYISSVLKEEGHRARLVVLSRESIHKIDGHIRSFNPGLVCFTSVYSEYDIVAGAAERVKKNHPEIFTVLGGSHATLNPDQCLGSYLDAVCVGEGEYATLELVEQLEAGLYPSGIPNLHIRKPGGGVERNKPRPFLEDLDSLPFPDRDMWIPWVSNPYSRPSVLLGRGCPFRCTYCSNHALRRVAEGKYVRLRSPRNIVEELTSMREKNPYFGEVYLEVETLGVNRKWALELCSELRSLNSRLDNPIVFGANLRVTPKVDYRELFAAMAESNFRFVNIGLESGSERIRKEVLKRYYSNRDIIKAVERAREYNLQVGLYNLIGLPGETRKDFRETVRVNRICQPDWFLLAVFFPYPGTELHDTCRDMGLLDGELDINLERRRPVLDLPAFNKRQVGRRRDWFPMLVYGGRRPLKEVLWLVAMAKIYSNRRAIGIHRRLSRGYFLKRAGKEKRESIEAPYALEEDRSHFMEPDPLYPGDEAEKSRIRAGCAFAAVRWRGKERKMAEHIHQEVGEEIRSVSGYYMVLEEGVLEYGGREVLYLVGAAAADTSCCGSAGMGFIMVPGYIKALKTRRGDDGLWISDVDRIDKEEDRVEITRLIKARHPGFQQVNFA